ncbi:unnamed protein product [Periconia digitata]|uniref:Uncharacterized protein n=1 Tax=Periconia digitata TaxID=1303443 RepID=A0A9W4UPY3_9PLEO|nr:unnamed protein product [Periconia digitata]
MINRLFPVSVGCRDQCYPFAGGRRDRPPHLRGKPSLPVKRDRSPDFLPSIDTLPTNHRYLRLHT